MQSSPLDGTALLPHGVWGLAGPRQPRDSFHSHHPEVWSGLGRPLGSRVVAAKFTASSRTAREALWAAMKIREWSGAPGKGDPGGLRGQHAVRDGGLQLLVRPLSFPPSPFGTAADPVRELGRPEPRAASPGSSRFPHTRSACSSPR